MGSKYKRKIRFIHFLLSYCYLENGYLRIKLVLIKLRIWRGIYY